MGTLYHQRCQARSLGKSASTLARAAAGSRAFSKRKRAARAATGGWVMPEVGEGRSGEPQISGPGKYVLECWWKLMDAIIPFFHCLLNSVSSSSHARPSSNTAHPALTIAESQFHCIPIPTTTTTSSESWHTHTHTSTTTLAAHISTTTTTPGSCQPIHPQARHVRTMAVIQAPPPLQQEHDSEYIRLVAVDTKTNAANGTTSVLWVQS